ncbi:MAG: type III PLP-dependent enzyme [Porticoccaceae bacterium]|nr:type III PLP-dependent enzyme [Porticoccaceae bacterium]
MTDLAVTPTVVSALNKARLLAEEDAREQIAFSAAYADNYRGPVLVVSAQRLRRNVQRFMAALPRVRPHFAVKANPDAEILSIFHQQGTCFEVASIAEIDAMLALGVDMETVFYSNPIKSSLSIKHGAASGIVWYCVDTPEEVEKIAAIKPDAKLYLRIQVSNEGSSWPLAGKFGASSKGVDALIDICKKLDMQLCGATFHVGSQCTNIHNWVEGIRAANGIFAQLIAEGFSPELLNLGGGYPLQFSGQEPSIEDIAAVINPELDLLPKSIQIMAEPGRYLVGSAGCLISQVVGIATRDSARWVYLDTGVYGGLMELSQNFPATLVSQRTGEAGVWTMAGPTCDSIDVLGKHRLPINTEADDIIFMPNLGAYCTTCACDFNGFPTPTMHMVD